MRGGVSHTPRASEGAVEVRAIGAEIELDFRPNGADLDSTFTRARRMADPTAHQRPGA